MKLTPNVALKVAIVESGKTQRVIARRARVPESKLSHFVRGRIVPTEKEQAAIAKAIGRPAHELFPRKSEAA